MRWANLKLRIPDNWMTQMLNEHNVQIRVFGCVPYQSRGGRGLIRLSSDENLDVLLEMIRKRKDVVKTCFSHVTDREVVGEVVIEKCAACTALKQSDCFMASSRSSADGWMEWTVAAESNGTIYDLVDRLAKNKCDVHLTKISASSSSSGLTIRQEEILQFAFSNGYYEYPRRISLRALSHIFEVAPSTMSEILRAGQRRIFSEYFGGLPSLTCSGKRRF